MIRGKNIILGVTGGIAAYKALELTRALRKEEANVFPVMSECAREFITPLSLSTLACNPVLAEMFEDEEGGAKGPSIDHVDIASKADLLIVAPATANTIGKIAAGVCDNMLTTVTLACAAKKLIAPSMNHLMYSNPIVQENIAKLKRHGYYFVGPDEGELACGWEGKGRLSSVEDIMEAVRDALSIKDFAGEKVLITAGATREPIDPVRFVSNASSGRMGYAIARAAKRRGAEVVLVSGPSYLSQPKGIDYVGVESTEQMKDAVISHYPQSTVVIMAAAVSDFKPAVSHSKKMKKEAAALTLDFERTPDILKELGSRKKGQVLVGFALETDDMIENATKKLREKNLDLVVANGPKGLNSEVNQVSIISVSGKVEELESMYKYEIADRILDRVARIKG
ncbi:MAG: bifunctional phosphopantothenoylcysteine decarboxylase/phosphopantothenate--cysteine ligase CoaBC [Deltaproteobacteria bacterium]|nr:bifunctional phosphopantothenoylcysteine decarboxylase/phosphopantothenate--cysteine ligase CoaBC [Deltaproteobacteria bacterium]